MMNRDRGMIRWSALRYGLVVAIVAAVLTPPVAASAADPANLALGAAATASSAESAGLGAGNAIDGDLATRWSSSFSDPQAIELDLGASAAIERVTLRWEAAYGSGYTVETSSDRAAWTPVFATTSGDGGTDDIATPGGSGRYVRLTGTTRATPYGYSLFEFEVYGTYTETAVSLSTSTVDVPENGSASVAVKLNRAADTDITVDYATADGSAVSGSDYRPTSGTLTFAAGETSKTVTVRAIDDAVDEQTETFQLSLSHATVGIGPRAYATVRVIDDDNATFDGETRTVDDFEGDLELFTFGGDADDNPTLSAEAVDRPQGSAGNHALRVRYQIDVYGGLVHNLAGSQDWTGFDGLAFWFKGSGTGQRIQYEMKDGGTDGEHAELWQAFLTDTSSDWRLIRTPFSQFERRTDYQPAGGPTDGQLNLSAMWGYAMNLPQASGSFLLDEVSVYQQVATLDSFEGTVPIVAPPGPGIFTFGADAGDNPTLTVEPARGGHVLKVDYHADPGGYGGLVHNLTFDTDPQDWSGFAGIRFWFRGDRDVSLPAGSGPRIFLEVKDGGANAEASELWNTSFTDDFAGWTLISIPFHRFVYRPDYQPVGGINHLLDLTAMWGFAVTPPAGTPGSFALDDIQVYGVAGAPPVATVDTDRPVYPVNEGETAVVGVTLSTRDGHPLPSPVTVAYSTEGPAGDYTPASGTVTFEAGTGSGATRTFMVTTTVDSEAEVAEAIQVKLTSAGAGLAPDLPAMIVINAHGLPYLDPSLPVEARVADLLGRMSTAEKVGQMTQAERNALRNQDDIASYALGSLLSGGGSAPTPNTPAGWADMVDAFQLRAQQTRLQIPIIYGVDAVHGHNNVIGATIFPHNVGLGASRDPGLVQRIGSLTAEEVRATGIPWDFAPCLCVSRDERWGRAYESFGEDPALVSLMSTIVTGLQGPRVSGASVLATAKHWVGDGGTAFGSSSTGSYTIDQGVTRMTLDELWRTQIAPYVDAINRGVGSVMPSYSSVDTGAGPLKMHANKYLITDVLKGQLGFRGFVISDWQAIDQIPGDYRSDIRTSINAGLDMIMVPSDYPTFTQLLGEEIAAGSIPMSRIDDAVSRILRQKFALGLFEHPYADRTHIGDVGSAAHRAVAREAVAKSQVLLKNSGVLPLARTGKIYVAGSNADDLGNQAGGWTVSWQGGSGATIAGTTILGGIREVAPGATVTYSRDASADMSGYSKGIVVVGETPYAEGIGDIGNGRADLSLSAADRQAIDRVCAAMTCVVVVVSGRPQLIDPAQMRQIDALVAAWLPGSEGAGVADTLFGRRPYTGRLPVTWPRDMTQLPINVSDLAYNPFYGYGWGLRTDPAKPRLKAARDAIAAELNSCHRDPTERYLRAAVRELDQALKAGNWNRDGSVRDARVVLDRLDAAAADLSRVDAPAAALDAIASVARDIAQSALVARPLASAVTLAANAEHELLSGRAYQAVHLLRQAWRLVR